MKSLITLALTLFSINSMADDCFMDVIDIATTRGGVVTIRVSSIIGVEESSNSWTNKKWSTVYTTGKFIFESRLLKQEVLKKMISCK